MSGKHEAPEEEITLNVKKVAKAVSAGVTAGLTALGTAVADGTLTGSECIGVGLAVLAAYGIVYRVPNAKD